VSQLYIYLPWFLTVSGQIVICKVETCSQLYVQCTRHCWSFVKMLRVTDAGTWTLRSAVSGHV